MKNTEVSLDREAYIYIHKYMLEKMSKEEIIEHFLELYRHKNDLLKIINNTLKPFHLQFDESIDCNSEESTFVEISLFHSSKYTEGWNKKHTKFLAENFNDQGEFDFRKND